MENLLKKQVLAILILLLTLTGCSQMMSPKGGAWPGGNAKVAVQEAAHLDLSLRVLALELNQEAQGSKQYFMQFLPQQGKIEVSCLFKSMEENELSQRKSELEGEVNLVQAGVVELLNNLRIRQGFDAKKNLYIRFQMEGPEKKEVAIYEQGALRSLTLPTGKK